MINGVVEGTVEGCATTWPKTERVQETIESCGNEERAVEDGEKQRKSVECLAEGVDGVDIDLVSLLSSQVSEDCVSFLGRSDV